jgi:hypothetical protein
LTFQPEAFANFTRNVDQLTEAFRPIARSRTGGAPKRLLDVSFPRNVADGRHPMQSSSPGNQHLSGASLSYPKRKTIPVIPEGVPKTRSNYFLST